MLRPASGHECTGQESTGQEPSDSIYAKLDFGINANSKARSHVYVPLFGVECNFGPGQYQEYSALSGCRDTMRNNQFLYWIERESGERFAGHMVPPQCARSLV